MKARPFAVAGVLGLLFATIACQEGPPAVPFARVSRQDIATTIKTNGVVRPLEWTAIRARRAGPVDKILVEQGQQVRVGDVLVELDSGSLEAELDAAKARITSAKADLEMIRAGGARPERVSIANELEAARIELEAARDEVPPLERLVAKNAATPYELSQARARVREAESRVAALERKLGALVPESEAGAVKARLAEAEAEAQALARQIELSRIRTPIAGQVYRLETRPGDFLNTGELVAEVGVLDELRAVIYVDEPELGNVAVGMPVRITWDALPARSWEGRVEKTPSEIVALGTRQVGEVSAVINNPGGELPAGANINAEIESKTSDNALAVPKETLRRQGSEVGVYRLQDDHIEWRPVSIGASNLSQAEVTEGLADGDAVALPAEVSLEDGLVVEPVFSEQ